MGGKTLPPNTSSAKPTSPREAIAPPRLGFTLIELSIVLVIIGLIAGGILGGQDLIDAARMRSQISQIEQLETVVNTFKIKYNCLPGDCRNATQFLGGSTQPELVTNGNGDKKIDAIQRYSCGGCADGYDDRWIAHISKEAMRAFDHLAAASLVSLSQYDETDASIMGVPGKTFPISVFSSRGDIKASPNHWAQPTDANGKVSGPFGIMFGYQVSDLDRLYIVSGHYIRIGVRQLTNAGQTFISGEAYLQPWDAMNIDKKIDDALPYSGRMMIANDYGGYDLDYCADNLYATDPIANYRTAGNLRFTWGKGVQLACAVMIRTSF